MPLTYSKLLLSQWLSENGLLIVSPWYPWPSPIYSPTDTSTYFWVANLAILIPCLKPFNGFPLSTEGRQWPSTWSLAITYLHPPLCSSLHELQPDQSAFTSPHSPSALPLLGLSAFCKQHPKGFSSLPSLSGIVIVTSPGHFPCPGQMPLCKTS